MRLLTPEDMSRVLGGTPHFDRAAGPAHGALLAKHVCEVLRESLGEPTLRRVILLRQGPEDWLEGMDRLADFNSQGLSDVALERLASEEQTVGG